MNQLAPSPDRPLALRAAAALKRGTAKADGQGQAPGSAHELAHPVCLTGLRLGTRDTHVAPLIVERRDQEFVDGLLADLGEVRRHAGLQASTPARLGGTMRVFQPLQRVFNMVVLEAFCDVPGQPRLDPRKIDSSGFVLRRVEGDRHLAWLKAGTRVFGWDAVDETLDPDHDRRASAVNLGHPALDALAPSQQRVRSAGNARLASSTVPVNEDVQPLFVASPDVCNAAGKTLLFGNLRVAAGELTEGPAAPRTFGVDDVEKAQLNDHLVAYLRQGEARELFPPPGKRSFTTEEFVQVARATDTDPAAPFSRAAFDKLDRTLGLLLVQLNNEFDAFGTSQGARDMQAALKQVEVQTDTPSIGKTGLAGLDKIDVSGIGKAGKIRFATQNAWDFLVQAKAVMLDAVPGASVTIPDRFGAVSGDIGMAIFDAMLLCLQQQFANVLPASGRFHAGRGGVDAQFVVRAFIRLKPDHPGCPGRLLWSHYSEPFTIAPWFESSGVPMPVIPLPDLMDREQLKRVRPTVAFALPAKLAALLQQNSAKDLADGKGKAGDGAGGLEWICSFSLPIITLCAFIVLNIFLQLFNLIFFWLPFLKICIPIPKAKE